MQVEEFGWEYAVRQHFPNAREIRRFGYEYLYIAEQAERFYLIDDRSLTADYICPLQPGIAETAWVSVFTFDSAAERQAFVDEHWPADRISISVDSL